MYRGWEGGKAHSVLGMVDESVPVRVRDGQALYGSCCVTAVQARMIVD